MHVVLGDWWVLPCESVFACQPSMKHLDIRVVYISPREKNLIKTTISCYHLQPASLQLFNPKSQIHTGNWGKKHWTQVVFVRLRRPKVIALMFHNLGYGRLQLIPSLLWISSGAPRQVGEEPRCENWKSGDATLAAMSRQCINVNIWGRNIGVLSKSKEIKRSANNMNKVSLFWKSFDDVVHLLWIMIGCNFV